MIQALVHEHSLAFLVPSVAEVATHYRLKHHRMYISQQLLLEEVDIISYRVLMFYEESCLTNGIHFRVDN